MASLQGHSGWDVHVSLYELHATRGAISAPVATVELDTINGTATFEDLVISDFGRYYLEFRLVSTPAEFDVSKPTTYYVDVFPEGVFLDNVVQHKTLSIKGCAMYANNIHFASI